MTFNRKFAAGIAALLVVLCAAFAGAAAGGSHAENSIVIGLPVSLSGNWAMLGNEVLRGATLAAEEINQAGGVLGRKIKLSIQDSDEAVSSAKLLLAYQYLRSQGVQIFIGPTGTPGGLSLAPVAERDDVLLIAPAVGVTKGFQSSRGNLFNIQGGWEDASRLLARYSIAVGYRRMAIFSSTHPFEKTQADAFQREFERLGGRVTVRLDPSPDASDLSQEALLVVRSSPDAIFHAGYNQMAIAARRERELGFARPLLAIQIDPSRLEGSSGALDGAVFARLAHSTEEFDKKFKLRFGVAPNYPADFGYDAVKVFAHAAQTSGTLIPSGLARALKSLHWSGASGDFSFGDDGAAIRTPSLWRVQGEEFEILGWKEP